MIAPADSREMDRRTPPRGNLVGADPVPGNEAIGNDLACSQMRS